MRNHKTIVVILVIIAGITIDQYSKHLAVNAMLNYSLPIEVTSFFNIAFAWNTGISFSLFSSDGELTKWMLTGFALLLSALLFFWLLREESFLSKIGFGFIISGAIGNAFDRIWYGAVVDFLNFHYEDWHFPTFNIADVFINIGVGLMLIHLLFFGDKQVNNSK